MSHYYGIVQGNRGEATRCGSKDSGMETKCASWEGAVRCHAYFSKLKKQDWVCVELVRWKGEGLNFVIYDGPISGSDKMKLIDGTR